MRPFPRFRSCLVAFAIGLALPSAAAAEEEFRFSSYEEILEYYDELGYTPEAWEAGIRTIPRVYYANVPKRWGASVSKEISIQLKKRLFFRALGPLALRSNELILEDRERLLALAKGGDAVKEDTAWLRDLALRYRVITEDAVGPDAAALQELTKRVDIVPLSLTLAQAAEESDWGTSRFADEGNAIFGQWTWGGKGITPKGQRSNLGDYKIAAFDSPLGSVQGYMLNINTNAAYSGLRDRRAALRADGKPVTGGELVPTLTSYSERGEEYVDSLQAIMRVNKLAPADNAVFQDGPAIILRPVGEGAE